jgi:hypothetical protein
MKQLMLDLVHPASNQILLTVNRGGPAGESDWAEIRRSALTLAESGTVLMAPGQGPNQTAAQADWARYAGALADAGRTVYQAAQAKDAAALASAAGRLDATCTACHKEFRHELFAQKFSEGRRIGHRTHHRGRRSDFYITHACFLASPADDEGKSGVLY